MGGKAKLAEVVGIAMIWDFWANAVMLWPCGCNMGCGGDGAVWKKARAGCKGRLDVRGVRCWTIGKLWWPGTTWTAVLLAKVGEVLMLEETVVNDAVGNLKGGLRQEKVEMAQIRGLEVGMVVVVTGLGNRGR